VFFFSLKRFRASLFKKRIKGKSGENPAWSRHSEMISGFGFRVSDFIFNPHSAIRNPQSKVWRPARGGFVPVNVSRQDVQAGGRVFSSFAENPVELVLDVAGRNQRGFLF
jgi:hypothetical protein